MYYHKSKMVVVKNYVIKTEIFPPEVKQKLENLKMLFHVFLSSLQSGHKTFRF